MQENTTYFLNNVQNDIDLDEENFFAKNFFSENKFILNLKDTLANINAISLNDLADAELMDRRDTKFIFHQDKLINILLNLSENYNILEVSDSKLIDYETLYFDTPTNDFFTNHQNGKKNRLKIRSRRYVNNDLSFLEIKNKNNKGKTIKTRQESEGIKKELNTNQKLFILENSGISAKQLKAKVLIRFKRMTLVHKNLPERLTLDIDLKCEGYNKNQDFPNIVIAEIKQEKINRETPAMRFLRDERIRPLRISKYCFCSVALNPNLKYNRFKKKILKINKRINGIH